MTTIEVRCFNTYHGLEDRIIAFYCRCDLTGHLMLPEPRGWNQRASGPCAAYRYVLFAIIIVYFGTMAYPLCQITHGNSLLLLTFPFLELQVRCILQRKQLSLTQNTVLKHALHCTYDAITYTSNGPRHGTTDWFKTGKVV